jgi:anhydro-N-acetylmuramic acid kinase
MSGSSMDGVDLAYCEFLFNNGAWNYDIKAAETIAYDENEEDYLRTVLNNGKLVRDLTFGQVRYNTSL